jgi:hypothetical protein
VTVRADNRLADAPMVPVSCSRCAATVLARKSSWQQTSIQWSADAYDACTERQAAELIAAHRPHGVFLGCAALKESLAEAVRRGEVGVVEAVLSTG